MNAQPFVTVFTITFNQEERIRKTLEGLFAQDYPKDRYAIVVLDDGSTDGTGEALKKLAATAPVPLRIVSCTHDADYLNARRWNAAIAAADERTGVFIQVDDVELRPDFIRQHIKWHTGAADHLVTGSKFEADETTWDLATCQRGHLANKDGSGRIVDEYTAIWGASMSFTKKLIEKIYAPPYDLPYDERMNGWGYHEVEFAYRMQQAGAAIVYDPAAGVFHKNHVQKQELQRGMDREEIVSKDSLKNERYLLQKHGLEALPRW
jgi:glycosyltransferase involved in cell wall biosynthesis